MQVDVQSMNNSLSAARSNTQVSYSSNYSQSLMVGNSAVEYISNSQNPTKADIAGLLLLDTRAAEVAMTSQQGSKRATPALNGKTAAVSTSLTNDKGARKVDGGGSPGDPNPGGSLPIGEGIWTMLLLASFYSSKNLKWFRK
jgi:hypothetical protein